MNSRFPENLLIRHPLDGLCGKTDEDNLGVSYQEIDRYITDGCCAIEAHERLTKGFTRKIFTSSIQCRHFKEETLRREFMGEVFSVEYAVEVNDSNGFVRQLDVFQTYEDAIMFQKECDEPLDDGEYLRTLAIKYDEDGNEIGLERIY